MRNMNLKILEWWASPTIFFKDVFGDDAFDYQADVLRDIKDFDINRILICAAGGTGKTKLIAGVGLFGAVVLSTIIRKPYRVIILGGSEQQSRIVYNYIRNAIQNNPILTDLVKGDTLKSITEFKNGSVIKALAKSFSSIYGQHGDLVIVDEAVEAGDFVIRDSMRIIGESEFSRIILSTTPHDYGSLFVDMWLDNEEYPEYDSKKKVIGSWKRYTWSAIDCPRITNDMVKEAKKGLPVWMFQVYWLGEPYPIMGTMLSLEKVKIACKNQPLFKYEDKYPNPILGFDWGFHPNPGAAILVQLKDNIWYVLLFKLFHKVHPDKVLDWIETTARDYDVSDVIVDASSITEYMRLMDRGIPVTPVKFKNQKFIMQANLTNIFEKELIRIPEEFITLTKQLKKYKYETKIDEDLVDALMLATRAERQREMDLYYKITSFKKRDIMQT